MVFTLGNRFSAAQRAREDAAEVAQRAISEALGMEMPVEVVAREARPGGVSQKRILSQQSFH